MRKYEEWGTEEAEWGRMRILLPHSAGNSVKVESGNGRPDTVKSENVKNVPSFRAEWHIMISNGISWCYRSQSNSHYPISLFNCTKGLPFPLWTFTLLPAEWGSTIWSIIQHREIPFEIIIYHSARKLGTFFTFFDFTVPGLPFPLSTFTLLPAEWGSKIWSIAPLCIGMTYHDLDRNLLVLGNNSDCASSFCFLILPHSASSLPHSSYFLIRKQNLK